MAAPVPGSRADVLHETLVQAGLGLQREGTSTWRSSIDTWGDEIPLCIRLSEHWLEMLLDPFVELPAGTQAPDDLRRELLRLNRDLHHMKFGISPAGTVVLCAEMLAEHLELPAVHEMLAALAACVEEYRARIAILVAEK